MAWNFRQLTLSPANACWRPSIAGVTQTAGTPFAQLFAQGFPMNFLIAADRDVSRRIINSLSKHGGEENNEG